MGRRKKLGDPLEKLPMVSNDQDDALQLQEEKCAEMRTQEILRGTLKFNFLLLNQHMNSTDLEVPCQMGIYYDNWMKNFDNSDFMRTWHGHHNCSVVLLFVVVLLPLEHFSTQSIRWCVRGR